MERRRRTKILINADPSLANQMAATISASYPIKEVIAPRQGLTMIKMRETAQNSLFYIGEVLMTEAKVEVKGMIGIGMVIGMKEDLAWKLAIIDAAYLAELPETVDWKKDLVSAEEGIKEHQLKKQAKLMKTKVNFETMDVD